MWTFGVVISVFIDKRMNYLSNLMTDEIFNLYTMK
jgi:hypothetical protein